MKWKKMEDILMNVDRSIAYLKAKGLSFLLPAVTGNGKVLETLIDTLKEKASAKALEIRKSQDAEKRQFAADSMDMFFEMVKRNLPRFSSQTQRKLAFNMFFNHLTLGQETRDRYMAKYGEPPPFLLVISPSMRCNLNCFGCYASEYDKSQELSRREVSDIIRQAKEELGIYFITITGGEPTIWPHLFDVLEEHDDVFFQIYTHGMMIDNAMAKRMAQLGNVHPALSIEGGPKETNERRGKNAYDKIMAAMDRLSNEGVLFGFSVTHTTKNHHAITSEEFIDELIKHGPSFGWYFQYLPTGRTPDPSLIPSAKQRLERFAAIEKFRKTKPIVVYDFWNDGEATEGCLAWGRKYLHITASGMVEPCVFIHMATHNIREHSIAEILNSPCFKEARSMQPFNEDNRRPCCIIDNPDKLAHLYQKYHLCPTHVGGERVVTELHDVLMRNAQAYQHELECLDAARHTGVPSAQ
jgi:MoaA/NifB/PqqE/SkfB family radical SAM enzyme